MWRRWVLAQDADAFRSAATLDAWAAATVAVAILLALASSVPVVDEAFQLRLGPAIALFLPALAVGITSALRVRSTPAIDDTALALEFVGSGLLQLFLVGLVVLCTPIGGAVFCSFLLFTAGYHGHALRASFAWPFLGLATALAVGVGIAVAPTHAHIAILAVGGVASVGVELIIGSATARADRSKRQVAEMREAINAQVAADRESHVQRLSGTLVDVMGASHDLNNALSAVQVAADHLQVWSNPDVAIDRQDVAEIGHELATALEHIKTLSGAIRARGAVQKHDFVSADPGKVLADVQRAAGNQFSKVNVSLACSIPPSVRLYLPGGEPTLRRVVENLVKNACEGDGVRCARNVAIALHRDPSGARVELTVRDDGPGFSVAELENGIEGFHTRKATGTGLGLYTSERLVRAAGGDLERANARDGGAVVTVRLPLRGP